jgi:hypothetical protein
VYQFDLNEQSETCAEMGELTITGVQAKVGTSHLNLRTSTVDDPILGRGTITVEAKGENLVR